MEKHNHDDEDFVSALNLNKDELFDIAMRGIESHFKRGEPLSKCILEMVNSMKSKDEANEAKIFSAGMIFCQMLSLAKEDNGHEQRIKKLKKKNKKTLPFTAKDLLKSVRDEMENKSSKDLKDNDSK